MWKILAANIDRSASPPVASHSEPGKIAAPAEMNMEKGNIVAGPEMATTSATQSRHGVVTLPELYCSSLKLFQRNPNFCGREGILERIDKVLRSPESPTTKSLRSVSLYGFGGIGKTQIALHYAFTAFEKGHYDAVFWVHADTTHKLSQSFQQIAMELELLDPKETVEAAKGAVMQWLTKPTKKSHSRKMPGLEYPSKWLIIFDNADSPESISEFWPSAGIGSVLLTSRSPQLQANFKLHDNIEIMPLGDFEAATLLRKWPCGVETVEDDLITLGRLLGGYPLALAQVAAFMRNNKFTARHMIDAYNEQSTKQELYEVKSGNTFNEYQHSLSTVWGLETVSKHAMQLLDLLSYMDPDNIHECILNGESKPLFQTQADYLTAVSELETTSLIKRNPAAQRLTVHRIVQEGIRNRMNEEQKTETFVFTAKMLLAAWVQTQEEKFTHLQKNWLIASQVSPNIVELEHLYDVEKSNLHLGEDTKIEFARLLQKSGWYHNEKGYLYASLPLLQHSLEICDQLASSAEVSTLLADTLFGLATVYSQLNEREKGLEYAKKHHIIRIGSGSIPRHVGLASSELALCLTLNDKFEESLTHNDAAFEKLTDLPRFKTGEYWPDFVTISRAYALIGLGRAPEAITKLQEAINYRENRFGVDDTESDRLSYHLQILGIIHHQLGKYKTACDLLQRALKNVEATVGSQHYRAGQIYSKLGECCSSISELEDARTYFENARKIFSLYPYTKPELARAMNKQAILLRRVGDNKEADQLAYDAAKLYKELKPEESTRFTEEDFDGIVAIWSR